MEMLILNENELLNVNGGKNRSDDLFNFSKKADETYEHLRNIYKHAKHDYPAIKDFARGFRDGITGH
ncbi:hypothetical protein JW813_02575 [Clostridium botulinum]|uniref:hypothetical protein n=1 Tax=Clostridium botulinum TaxID=1491 RepID=UPI00144EC292|nr:hypothetical protein [Clostridium botulinum]NFO03900.1 hypothetical protein [Clostridium botulinum]UZP03900.1 hypothetical protein JW813_02575 [Clostridium botulinum]UZP07256.1 hypothetical protein JYA71_02570 [Clostridium botulinum]UZP10638.1 hypothetical protein JYA74_02570 [Clostridium botulinum]